MNGGVKKTNPRSRKATAEISLFCELIASEKFQNVSRESSVLRTVLLMVDPIAKEKEGNLSDAKTDVGSTGSGGGEVPCTRNVIQCASKQVSTAPHEFGPGFA